MKPLVKSRPIAIGVLCAVLGAALAGGAAHAITDTVFRYSTVKTGYVTVPAASFVAADSTATYTIDGGALFNGSGNCFYGTVNNLPQGAKLTAVAFWYSTNDAHGGQMLLDRQKLSDLTTVEIASSAHPVTTGGAYKGININITDTSLQPVDHQRYAYYVVKCLSPTEAFYGARITFTYTNAGD